jgi:DNA-binding MarR family transcriptional regulator
MNFEVSAVFLLAKVAVAHKNMLERRMESIGLHGGQVFVLLALWEQDGQRQIDLADTLNLAAPTVNKFLKGMVASGLVTRRRYEGDARSTRIYLTDAGRGLKSEVEHQWAELEARITADMTETERLILPQLLVKLLENYLNR